MTRRNLLVALRKKRTALFLLVLWMSVIFLGSSFPGGNVKYEMPLWLYLERKGAHVFEFFILTILSWNVFKSFFPRETFRFLFPSSAALALIYAIVDETHQLFVPGREGKVSDMWFDAFGIGLAVIGMAILLSKKPRRKRGALRKSDEKTPR